MVLFSSCLVFLSSLSHQQQKQNELAALFINAKEGKIIRMTLEEMGHKQPPTPIHCDNITATGIANNTVKKQQWRRMEMRLFLMYNGIQARKTWLITIRNILMVDTTNQWDRGTYTRKTVLAFYHEQQRLVLCEGVLEISPTDTIVRVRSRDYWYDSNHEYQ